MASAATAQRVRKPPVVKISAALNQQRAGKSGAAPVGLGLVAALAAHLAAQHRQDAANVGPIALHADPYQQLQQRQATQAVVTAPHIGGLGV